MNAKNDKWESYTDKAGRRHWRWPAASDQAPARLADDRDRHEGGAPRWPHAELLREHAQGD